MKKKTYYISVQSGDILQDEGAADFEFEIQATDEDISRLTALFEERDNADVASAGRSVTPYKEYHHDPENDVHDEQLSSIYSLIYRLGTPETKAHIEKMGILSPA